MTLRHEAGLTQRELAERAGLSDNYIALLERGIRGQAPMRTTVLALAGALGADPAAMLAAAGLADPSLVSKTTTPVIDELRKDPRLNTEQRAAIELTYRAFAGLPPRRRPRSKRR